MFPTATLLSTLFLASSVIASPIVIRDSLITLPLSKRLNLDGISILEHDQARAKAFRAKNSAISTRDAINQPLTNKAVTYVAHVDIGSPATTYSLVVDTGSANIWVGALQPYVRTSTSTQTEDQVSIKYGSASMEGTEFTDQVSLGPGLTIPAQSIGVASQTSGFGPGVDGILGIGPVELTVGTLSPHTTSTVPTVTDNLFSQGTISKNEIGISFEPTTSEDVVNGELTWGGIDDSKYTGSITYVPITATSPAAKYWGIDQSVRYGSSSIPILSTTAGIVDTGTTLILIATDAFQRYQAATGGVMDSSTSLLKLTSDQFANLQSLFFTIGDTDFELTPNAQIWPRSLNTAIGGTADGIYLIVADSGAPSGSGMDFLNGQVFHERFYTVYDTANQRVGIATTPFTDATTN
jgi:cathepsin E